MYAIGIDIGTTSICGVVINSKTGKVEKSCTRPGDAFLPVKNPWEKIQDAEKLIRTARDILDTFLAEYEVCVIGLTGQMHGIVYTDPNGQAVSPLYIWQDGRGNLPYKDTTYAAYLGSHTGYGNVTDFYNRQNGLRPAEAVSYCTIMDYLGMVLCGLTKPVLHATNAASFGCFDLQTLCFTYDCDAAVTDSFAIIGTYRGIPVSAAIGDNQASVFSTLTNEKDLLINVGTGSQVSMITDSIRTGEDIETRPYFDGKYLTVGAALCGGRAYGLLKDFFSAFLQAADLPETDIYAVLGKMISETATVSADQAAGKQKSPAPAPALLTDTRFAGTRSNPAITGSIIGITAENFTPGNLACSILQGMMTELHDMYAQMNQPHQNLVGSGNGIRLNPILVRIAENTFGGSLKIPAHTEEAACGAALYGLVACGAVENSGEAQKLVKYL